MMEIYKAVELYPTFEKSFKPFIVGEKSNYRNSIVKTIERNKENFRVTFEDGSYMYIDKSVAMPIYILCR
ncbi:hypothetical protein R54876_GBNLAHCA_00698 [Eupransor demetentiae]|uniref:Uncharacterized protein n=1 Tax=Eupransor demetentiae TaxID=3109584 RepID=A0ABM9N4U6_9LACO|nr:hypothetical protein R54876_GBNLAHCA_00698 [Lactobacillaceae bacterium LMG 33000]